MESKWNFSLSKEAFAAMMDVSAVQTQSSYEDAKNTVLTADQYDGSAVFLLGEMTRQMLPEIQRINERRLSEGKRALKIGSVAGFPDGGSLTEVKLFEASRMVELGCNEIDCVMNVGMALVGRWDVVEKDLLAIRKEIEGITLKVILETPYLTDEQIIMASKVAVAAGADWIKTSTGWPEHKKTTVENVRLMKQTVGEQCQIKAAGGIRNWETLTAMYEAGARLFGISYTTVQKLFAQE